MKKKQRYFIVLLLILLTGIAWYVPRRIIIKNFECESLNGSCSERVTVLLQSLTGQSLVQSKKSIRESLPADVVRNDISFQYHYPSTLKISVIETKPEFALSNNEKSEFRLVDADGNVLSNVNTNALPFARLEVDLPEVGTRLDEKYIFALGIMRDLARTYQLSEGILKNDGLLVELPTKTKVLFPLEGDRDVLLGSFILVINQLNTEHTSSTMDKSVLIGKTVDLRFKNPVIR